MKHGIFTYFLKTIFFELLNIKKKEGKNNFTVEKPTVEKPITK